MLRPVISRNCFMMFCSLPLNGLRAVLSGLGETGVSSEDSNCFCFTLRGPRTKCPDTGHSIISTYLEISVRISTGCNCNGCDVSYFIPHLFLTHTFQTIAHGTNTREWLQFLYRLCSAPVYIEGREPGTLFSNKFWIVMCK